MVGELVWSYLPMLFMPSTSPLEFSVFISFVRNGPYYKTLPDAFPFTITFFLPPVNPIHPNVCSLFRTLHLKGCLKISKKGQGAMPPDPLFDAQI